MVSSAPLPEFSGLRVLLVEDDPLIAMEMEEFLRGIGCEIVGPIPSLDEAMTAARAAKFDAAIADLDLRGQLSFPLIEQLRRSRIPVVCCSGCAHLPEMKHRLKDIPTLSKPWRQESLLLVMRTHFAPRVRPLAGAENQSSQTNPVSE